MDEFIFWASGVLIVYPYFGYPVLLYLLTVFSNNPVKRGLVQPPVTIIIAAYNEEQKIEDKIENTLSLNYPSEKKEIIVASDGSTDRTNQIVSAYKDKGIILVVLPKHKGKESAQWEAIKVATKEILVFTDTSTMIERDSLLHIVSNFHDPTVGCVSSEDLVMTDKGESDGEGFYVKYEMLLRRLESQVNSLVGLSGSFFAVRRELCREWSTDVDSDFITVFRALKKGFRAVSDPTVVGSYKTVSSPDREFNRKVRTVLRGISGLACHIEVLNPFRHGLFSFQVMSHKLLRWLVPLFMVCFFVSNMMLIGNNPFYNWLFAAQVVFYFMSILGLLIRKFSRNMLFKISAFYVLVNISIVVAWIKYFLGHRVTQWESSRK